MAINIKASLLIVLSGIIILLLLLNLLEGLEWRDQHEYFEIA